MTDISKYRNVSLSRKTYEDLQTLSKELLPGETELSISKTVETLVNERKRKKAISDSFKSLYKRKASTKEFRELGRKHKAQKSKNSMTKEEALKIIGGDLSLWGSAGKDALNGPPKIQNDRDGEDND